MIPTSIPDEEIWEGAIRRIILPPDGDMLNDEIRSVEALLDRPGSMGGVIRYCMRMELEPGELETLQMGGHIWIGMWGGIVPFVMEARA